MISILIPTYNFPIANLVSRIHKQAMNSNILFEIIVIDDASDDKKCIEINNTIKKIDHLQYLKNTNNLGRTATRNLLANKAKYNVLLFLDADVIPKYDDFISRFNLSQNTESVVFGGVCYKDKKPEPSKIFRWKYGIRRETKTVAERLKNPYDIISQNLLITKESFIKNNTIELNKYGLDILFSNNLKRNKVAVKHIDNPVYHLGLESNEFFLNKSLKGVKTTFELEKNKQIDCDFRPLQKSFSFLKKWRMTGLFYVIIGSVKTIIKKNLLSKNPSILLLDLYKLQYYIELKSNKND